MRLLICPQEFKGSLTAGQAASAIARGARRALGLAGVVVTVVERPLADGGPGTLDILASLPRSSGGLPLVVWGAGGLPRMVPDCPFCTGAADLRHFMNACGGTADLRRALPSLAVSDPMAWALRRASLAAGLELRVQYLGRCMVRLIAAARARAGQPEIGTAAAAP